MAVAEATLKALELKNLPIPPSLPVVRIEVQEHVDWTRFVKDIDRSR